MIITVINNYVIGFKNNNVPEILKISLVNFQEKVLKEKKKKKGQKTTRDGVNFFSEFPGK